MRKPRFIQFLYKQIISFILLASILGGAFSATTQAQRKSKTPTSKSAPAANSSDPKNASTPKCDGGWSGIITFTKTLKDTHNSTAKGVTAITTQHVTSRDYDYKGRVVVDGSNPKFIRAKGQASLTDSDKRFKRVEAREDCRYDKQPSIDIWKEFNDEDVTNAFAEGEADFNLQVNEFDGTYGFSFRLPEAKGVTDTLSSIKAHQCVKQDYPTTTKKFPVIVPGEQAQIDDQKIDLNNPDVLSGTKTWDTTSSIKSFVYKVSWSFKKCPAPVEVIDVKFDERPYEKPSDWKEIGAGEDTIDGNRVRIRAKVVNYSGETKFPTIKFHELIENWQLPEGEKSIRLEAGEEKEIELEWDTSGYAWKGKGWDAESNRKIKVEAIDEGRTSQLTKPVIVSPRPVILVHGLWSNAAAWSEYKTFFYEAHSKKWSSFAVGEETLVGKMNTGDHFLNDEKTNTVSENAVVLDKQIEHVRHYLNAWHVDIVAHSMGGLISRLYIQKFMRQSIDEKPVVTKLIMLGTPNMGSPCADLIYHAFYLYGKRVEALRELKPSIVEQFNEDITDRRGVRFSALVGKAIPKTCQYPDMGDGVVPVQSAIWKIRDWRYSKSIAHTDLTSHADFGAFVFPRLSTGPRGNHDIELISLNNPTVNENYAQNIDGAERTNDRYGFGNVFQKASYQTPNQAIGSAPNDEEAPNGLTLAKEIKLQPNQTAEIEIPALNTSRATIVFLALPQVSATLTDASGVSLGKNLAGTPEARQMFRTIAVEKAVSGNLKLKLESRETKETIVYAAVFAETNPLSFELTAGKPSATKQVTLQARLINNNSPVTGANVKARLQSETGQTSEIVLFDDGAHNDGAAGDGVYGALTEKLADGEYFIEASAETNGQTRLAFASVNTGAETIKPAKVTGKTKNK